jgi:hypothetical protein
MNIFNYDFKDNKNEDRDYINDLIFENIALMDNNIKLLVENRRLREKVEGMKSLNKRNPEKTKGKTNQHYVIVTVIRDKKSYKD